MCWKKGEIFVVIYGYYFVCSFFLLFLLLQLTSYLLQVILKHVQNLLNVNIWHRINFFGSTITLSVSFFYFDKINHLKDKEIRKRLQDSELKLGSSMPLDQAKERAAQLEAEVTTLERYIQVAMWSFVGSWRWYFS